MNDLLREYEKVNGAVDSPLGNTPDEFNEFFNDSIVECQNNQHFLLRRNGWSLEEYTNNLTGVRIICDGKSAVYTKKFKFSDNNVDGMFILFIRVRGENFKLTPLTLSVEAAVALFDSIYDELGIKPKNL